MFYLHRSIPVLFFLSVLFLVASCSPKDVNNSTETPTDTPVEPKAVQQDPLSSIKEGRDGPSAPEDVIDQEAPKPNFSAEQTTQLYTNLLAGEWLDISDPNYTVNIVGTVFKTYKLGELESESDISMDKLCTNTACNLEGHRRKPGVCMMLGSKCYVLMQASKTSFSLNDFEANVNKVYKRAIVKRIK